MTEAEWLTCAESNQLWGWVRGTANWRKCHLLCAGCARRTLIPELPPEIKALVDLVELSADVKMDRYALGEPRLKAIEARELLKSELARRAAMAAINSASIELHANSLSVSSVLHDAAHATPDPDAEYAAQCNLLRDIFGNPFRPITFNPAWRTSDVMLLAQGIYDDRAFDRMPILADALQDAGCDNDDILNHLRDVQATHVRGCWALDLVLGKE